MQHQQRAQDEDRGVDGRGPGAARPSRRGRPPRTALTAAAGRRRGCGAVVEVVARHFQDVMQLNARFSFRPVFKNTGARALPPAVGRARPLRVYRVGVGVRDDVPRVPVAAIGGRRRSRKRSATVGGRWR